MPTDASIRHGTIIVRIIFLCINEKQRETHALFGKKSKSLLVNLSRG